ncbi:glycosyltransferase family 39 protein [Agromyces sp. G08B096]|uniref:Glycosyltransferase family 39 protein n=1 Tax=Agromyces sp. G08B096 TaxID=3156399 RepID=A0AAU7W3W6_9MICO
MLLVVASLLVGIVHVPQHQSLSPIDEYVYVDYYDKVLQQGVVREGEEVGDYARRELGCRGLRILLPVPDDRCTTASTILDDDSRFPMGGITSADIYTPLYFAITRALAEPLILTGLIDSPTQAGRFMGALWLAGAALLLYLALRRLRVSPWIGGGATLLVVGSLPAYWYTTYLSTDAPTMLAGALLLYLAIRFVQGASAGWWLVGAAPVVVWLKFQNFAAVGAIALALLFLALSRAVGAGGWREFRRDRRTLVALGMVLSAVSAQLLWLGIRSMLSLHIYSDQGTAQPLTGDTLLGLVFRYLVGAGQGVGGPAGAAILVSGIATWVGVVGVVGLAAVSRSSSSSASLAYGTLAMALVLGPLLAVMVKVTTGDYFPLPERYGLSLYPLFVACATLLVRERRASSVVLAGLGAVSYTALLFIGE